MAGYLVLGMGFGILLETKGYGAAILEAALMTLMVNARHLFYGISMIERYRSTNPYKPYLIFGLTDETYSLVCSGDVPEGVDC